MSPRHGLLLALASYVSACGAGLSHPERSVESGEVAIAIPASSGSGEAYTLLVNRTEVSQREYVAITGRNASWHDDCPDCPVENVSWYEAAMYANARSAQEGLEACYVLTDCGMRAPADDESRRERRRRERLTGLECAEAVSRGPACTGYRLPTRAESDAFRPLETVAGSRRTISRVAVFDRSGPSAQTNVVGGRAPDRFGLYDVFGNVEEWLDERDSTPADLSRYVEGETRWYGTAGGCLFSTRRSLQDPPRSVVPGAHRRSCVGFRLVRTGRGG